MNSRIETLLREQRKRLYKWWCSPLSNGLQRINVVASLMLASVALYLTHKYGENTDSINVLTGIASQQNQEIKDLRKLLSVDSAQLANSNLLIGQMRSSNDKLVYQTGQLTEQTSILSEEQAANHSSQVLSDRASYILLRKATWKLHEPTSQESRDMLNTPNPSLPERYEVIRYIQSVLESMLSNPYLLKHKKLSNDWNDLYIEADVVLTLDNAGSAITYKDGDVAHQRILSPSEVEHANIQRYNDFMKHTTELELEVFQTKWKKGDTTVF